MNHKKRITKETREPSLPPRRLELRMATCGIWYKKVLLWKLFVHGLTQSNAFIAGLKTKQIIKPQTTFTPLINRSAFTDRVWQEKTNHCLQNPTGNRRYTVRRTRIHMHAGRGGTRRREEENARLLEVAFNFFFKELGNKVLSASRVATYFHIPWKP